MDSTLHGDGSQPDRFELARRNTVKTLLLVAICFVLCWTNSQVYYLLYNTGYGVDLNAMIGKINTFLAFCICTINPFIYLIKYKCGIKKLLCL